jgi:hypothetical protein
VLARVAPFQQIVYIVRLDVNYVGGLDPEDSAYMYDLRERRAEKPKAARIQPGSGPPSAL